MMISQALYRARQFWLAWRAKPLLEEDLAPARSILTAAQMKLFTHLQPSEQYHALQVLQTIQGKMESDPDLLTAALLHDIGKAHAPLRLWERVLVVLGRTFFPSRVRSWGGGLPRGWKRAFVIAEQHPSWGAEMASQVGTSPKAVSLIRRHQTQADFKTHFPDEDHLLKILQDADHQN